MPNSGSMLTLSRPSTEARPVTLAPARDVKPSGVMRRPAAPSTTRISSGLPIWPAAAWVCVVFLLRAIGCSLWGVGRRRTSGGLGVGRHDGGLFAEPGGDVLGGVVGDVGVELPGEFGVADAGVKRLQIQPEVGEDAAQP